MNLNKLNKTIRLRRNANFLLKLSKNVSTNHNNRLMKNYYQILGVSENCSKKELRLAYLNLCKQYHPDLNADNSDNSKNNCTKFQEINEAYNCLIKDEDRQEYDRSGGSPNSYDRYWNSKYKDNYGYDKNFYEREAFRYYEDLRRRRQQEEMYRKRATADPNNFYGIKGIKKMNNITIAYLCVAVAVFGAMVQFLHYKAAELRLIKARKDSIRFARSYDHAKKKNATLEEHIAELERKIYCQKSKDPLCDLD